MSRSDLDTIDIHSLDLYATQGYPWAEWDLLRREAPVYWYDRPGIEPFWAFTRYDDVHRIGRDARRFVNGGRPPPPARPRARRRMWEVKAKRDELYGWDPDEPFDMVFMDQPRHTAFRMLIVNRAFTPARCRSHGGVPGRHVAALRRRVRGHARSAGRASRSTSCEHLSVKLPARRRSAT